MKNRFLNLTKIAFIALLAMTTVFTSCKGNDDDDKKDPVVLVEDGVYIKGDAVGLAELSAKGAFTKGFNEATKKERAGMWEKFFALKKGATFSVVKVAGSTHTVYGAGTLASVDISGGDQPELTIQRGTFSAGGAAFTVPEDGLYHVVVDMDTKSMAIIPVAKWGIIGAAALGWGSDLDLPLSGSFGLTALKYEVKDAKLAPGEFKLRYGAGWKVGIDADGDEATVKCETSFGGAVDALAFGGANIQWAEAGFYTITVDWTLDGGIKLSTKKTGDVAASEWTGVVLDLVGDGVSADNTSAITDPSSWGWGNKLLSDNSGLPAAVGNVYTWTWTNVTLEANSGFKIRTENGVAPANGNGANFDAGFSGIDAAASTANIADAGGNMSVTVKAKYTITISIDAANADAKTIKIVDAAK